MRDSPEDYRPQWWELQWPFENGLRHAARLLDTTPGRVLRIIAAGEGIGLAEQYHPSLREGAGGGRP